MFSGAGRTTGSSPRARVAGDRRNCKDRIWSRRLCRPAHHHYWEQAGRYVPPTGCAEQRGDLARGARTWKIYGRQAALRLTSDEPWRMHSWALAGMLADVCRDKAVSSGEALCLRRESWAGRR